MSSAVIFDSRTGNTELLAQWIAEALKDCVYCGGTEKYSMSCEAAKEIQTYYVGFWTDKGSCSQKMRDFLSKLHGKRVYLFGTAGFGVSGEYFERILNNVKGFVPEDNEVSELFMCQGKMPASVRERYVKMLNDEEKAAQAQMLIKNFDMALQHPNDEDKKHLLASLEKIAK